MALGCLSDGAVRGYWPAGTAEQLTIHALRMLAFDHLYAPDVWRREEIWPYPQRPRATHELAGRLTSDEHLCAFYAAEHPGQPPLAQLVLFGRMLGELALPGLPICTSRAWLFSAQSRRVDRGTTDCIIELLDRRRPVAQTSML